MSATDEPEMLITPQVKPAEPTHAANNPNEAEDKKRRIDEALAHYEAHKQPAKGNGVASADVPLVSRHAPQIADSPEPQKPATRHARSHVKKRGEKAFIAEHLAEAQSVLAPRRPAITPVAPVAPIQAVAQDDAVIAPTHVEADATIALAAEAVLRKKAEQAAYERDSREQARHRYQPSDNPLHIVKNRRKFVQFGVVWLAAIPLALSINAVTSGIANSVVVDVVQAVVYILGAYGALGWVPLVVFYMREHNDW